ncbi:MAG: late control gene D protein [Bacteriophage sp.]|nr:MAG: late control gene D protein [Bacteriophage sp.]
MINVTNQLKTESLLNSNYYVTANAVLRDGTILSLGKEDFYLDGNGIVDSSDSGDFPVGVAIEKTATLALVNDDDRFTGYNFAGAQFTLFLNLQLSDRLETIRRGTFIVSKKPATSDEINLTLLDYMSKAETDYNTNLIFPCSVREVLEDVCQQTGIVLGDAVFKNADYQVQKKPENTTFRAVIGMVAALAGGNARIDENDNLRIITFDDGADTITLETIPWYGINGNTILDIDSNEIETILERKGFKPNFINNLTYDVDDVVVTGVKYVNNETEYKYGTDGYVITIDNKLLTGNEQVGVDLIGKELVGMRLRPFSCDSIAIGYATFGDRITFSDIKGNIYYSYLTDVDFAFSGSTSFACNAKSMEDIDADYPDSMQVEVDNLKKDSEKKITAYDAKLKQMNELAANTLGFYYTEEIQADGSTVSYRHDKPTLADSKVIYKTGIDGFFLSVDGGQTWKAGFDSNGDAVLNILYAIGIQSDWINTRGFTAKDNNGNITFRIDAETGAVNLNATELTIKGKTPENVANAEVEKFITEVYSPQIKVLQEQIDGQIEAFFGDYVPDGNNEPASTWTDDTTKEKHLGDLFYIVNNEEYGGQAYRYAKINGEYRWDYVKDTAVVKALADAAQAQNTANAKKRIFGVEPVPPYDIDDLWVQGKAGDILKCQKAKAEGASYDADDWVRASKYTDDSAVTAFIKGVFADTIESLQEQLDGKIQTWSQDTDPALEWTETEEIPWTDVDGNSILDVGGNEILIVWEKGKYIHKGDLWQNTANNANTRWRWDGNEWVEQKAPDYLFDKIDGKAAVYFEQPKPPYNMGDFWVTSKADGEASIKTAVRSRSDGAFTDTDWIDFKYADKTDIDNAVKEYDTSLGQDEVFNKLTNGGEDQGIYIQDKKLYINANYILAGVLAGKFINAKGIKVIDSDNQITLHIDDSGKVHIAATEFSLKGKAVSEIAKDTASNTATEIATKYATLSVLLSNEFQGIPTDSSGKYTTFPTCRTTVTVLYGADDVTAQSNISFSVENGISGSASGATYTVSGLSVDSGTITATATYNGMTAKKEFVVVKQKQGDTGNGISKIVQHYLATSSSSGVSTSSSGWTETVQIPTQDNRYLWNYEETFFTNGSKTTTLPHVIGVYGEKGKDGQDGKDASDMTQLEIFNKLTNNGETQGLYLYNNKVYLNASYIDTGYLAGWGVGYKKLSANGTYGEVTLDASAGEIYSETNTGVYVPGYGTLYGTRIRGTNLYTGTVHASSVSVNTSVSADSVSASKKVKAGTHVEASGHFYSVGTGTDLADLSVRGTKKRILSTKDYGTQAFYCYEMASPIFGDIGEASISEDGTCLIDIDDIFQESTNVGIEYYVFLQKEGDGDCWVDKKEQTYFIVKGTPGLKFAFEIKARQADYEHMRFADASEMAYDRAIDTDMSEPDYSESLEVSEPDYEKELFNDRENIIDEMGKI